MISNDERRKLIWGDGTLIKATLTYPDPLDKNKKKSIEVQFNPAEYSISRGVNSSETNGKGQNATPEQQQQEQESLATMQVKLRLDTTTYVEEDDEREARKWIEKYCLRQAEPAQCQDEEKRSHRESSNIIRTPWYRNRAVTARIILGGAAAMVAVLIGVSLYFG